jgi:hypothetical protein
MNVSEKNAIERMIDNRALEAMRNRPIHADKIEAPARLEAMIVKAFATVEAAGWDVYQGYSGRPGPVVPTLNPKSTNRELIKQRKAERDTEAAIAAAKDAAIIALWTTDEFDLAAVFASIDNA